MKYIALSFVLWFILIMSVSAQSAEEVSEEGYFQSSFSEPMKIRGRTVLWRMAEVWRLFRCG